MYTNPLMIIPYEKGISRNFVQELQRNIVEVFKSDKRKLEVFVYEHSDRKKDNEKQEQTDVEVNEKINTATQNGHDLLILFQPVNYHLNNGSLYSVTYDLVGVDPANDLVVWKISLQVSSSFGPTVFVDKAAKDILAKLKEDHLL